MRRNHLPNAFTLVVATVIGASSMVSGRAQEQAPWRDPSPHHVQLLTVDANVQLEVLDWGGAGRPIVLLSGLGNTAHVFDEFAPKLTNDGHVYGITRRGYGASSAPADGYDADRLGDDVLAVLNALKLTAPILVGHSIAGQELSSVASRHPERIAGVVYLDALFAYAYATPQEVGLRAKMAQLQNELQALQSRPLDPLGIPQADLAANLLRTMSQVQSELSALLPSSPAPPAAAPAQPSTTDLASFAALGSWFSRMRGFRVPEAELRQGREPAPEGRVGKTRTPASVPAAILAGARAFADIRVPALALCAIPIGAGPAATGVSEAEYARVTALREVRATAFSQNVAGSRVVRVPHANHYIFISHEADVLRELRAFLSALK